MASFEQNTPVIASEAKQSRGKNFSFVQAFVWILCLAAVSVGLKNFEPGISIDGPIFATVARNIARTGEWWLLDCSVPDLVPFAVHPHLGFWILAAVFKILPATGLGCPHGWGTSFIFLS